MAGGKVTKKYFGKVLELEGKSRPADFRTKADLESEKAILKVLEKAFPTYNIISEEAGEIDKKSEYTFVIDPLDGTNNFVLGIPYFSVGIGLMKGNEVIFGVIYNPILKNIYFAEKGKGSFLNNKKISVNKEADIENGTFSVIISPSGSHDYSTKVIGELYNKDAKRVLRNWSALLDFCLLASGKTEGMIVGGAYLHDFISGKLIANEAGALVTDFNGIIEKDDRNDTFLISNGTKIHQEILNVLNK